MPITNIFGPLKIAVLNKQSSGMDNTRPHTHRHRNYFSRPILLQVSLLLVMYGYT